MTPPNQLLRPSLRTTASHTPTTLHSKRRRRRPLVLVFPSLESQMKAASKTRSGQMLSLLPRRKRKTLFLDLVERPSASVSASRSSSLRSINALLRLPSVEDAVDSVAAVVDVEMAHPEVDEVNTVVAEVKAVEDAQEVTTKAHQEDLTVPLDQTPLKEALRSTPMIQALSPA